MARFQDPTSADQPLVIDLLSDDENDDKPPTNQRAMNLNSKSNSGAGQQGRNRPEDHDAALLRQPLQEAPSSQPDVVGATEAEIESAVEATENAVATAGRDAEGEMREVPRVNVGDGGTNGEGAGNEDGDASMGEDVSSAEDGYESGDVSIDSAELVEDVMDSIDADDLEHVGVSRKDSRQLCDELRRIGIPEFVHKYLESGVFTASQLCERMGFPVPDIFAEVADKEQRDDFALRILGRLLTRELKRRQKLTQYNTIDDAVALICKAKNILVLTGAGISTSLGIPDFRSQDGLYKQLEKSGLADKVDDPQDVFALRVFYEDPTIFYAVARSILSSDRRFSPTHQFIRLLQDKGKLLTNFTQNIDNLEGAAGIDQAKLIHCHGSFATATCQACGTQVSGDSIHDEIRSGSVPRCKACITRLTQARLQIPDGGPGMKRKRSGASSASSAAAKKRRSKAPLADWEEDSSDSDADMLDASPSSAAGIMKPDIVFFGEDLPQEFHHRAMADRDQVDLVIVIGTSLRVAPVSEVPNFIPPNVPQLYISRDPCKHINFDIELLGECDVVVEELCRRAGWELRHPMVPAAAAEVEVSSKDERADWHTVVRK